MCSIIKDVCNVLKKNILIDFKSPLSLVGQFIIPALVCLIIYLAHSSKTYFVNVFKQLLPFYLGNLTTSLIRKFSLFFIRERQQKFGKYQRIMGLSVTGYVFGNLMYCYILTILVVIGPILFLLYYNPSVFIITGFIAYFLASTSFFLMIVTYFKDAKLCSQVVTLVCGLSALLYYIVNPQNPGVIGYITMAFPPPCFVLQVLHGSKKALSVMLLTTKIYFVIFLYRQFQIHPLEKCKKCIKWYKNRFGDNNNNQQQIQEDQLEQAIVFEKQSIIKQSLLKIRNINKEYKKQRAIDNLSLTINKGEIFTILGRNGAGKTTLMNMISQIEKPTEGTIEYLQDDLKIGICFQEQALYEQLTIIQMLQFHSNIRKVEEDNLNQILDKIDINQSYIKPISALSGGTKRKLSLAISLLGNPSLLLYDEPTSGLDPQSRRQIWNILIGLKQEGKTIIITTHHLDEADIVSDRICIMEKGKILVIGSPLFIKKRFGMEGYNLVVRVGLNQVVQVESVIKKYGEDVSVIKYQENKNQWKSKYTLKCNQDVFLNVLKQLESKQDIEVNIELNSLENSFISIIQPQYRQQQLGQSQNQQLSLSPIRTYPQLLKSSFIKIFYLIKRRPFKYFILYNLNLVFLLFSDIIIRTLTHYHSSLIESIISTNIGFAIKIVLLIQGYIFSIGVYIYNPVYEREKHIKDLLRVRGMDWISYWLPQFLVDYSFFIVNSIVVYFYMERIISFIYLISFGASLIVFSYCCSYLFQTSSTAIRYFPIINFLFGLITPFVALIKKETIKFVITNVFIIIYPFSSFQDYIVHTLQGSHSVQSYFMLLYPFVFQVSLYSFIILCVQLKICSRVYSCILRQSAQASYQPIKFLNVSKKYKLFDQYALDNISFQVQSNQSFGIIGPNGAGKSTIYKLLTDQQYQSSGKIYLQNQLHYPYDTYFSRSSVCYQQDTLWQTLTPRQILTIFKYLSGSRQLQNHYEIKLGEDVLVKQFQKLSGGNKRKVCMEVCLIGDPELIYLDECSTGLDPLTRRIMLKKQNIIKEQEGCLVFTSHSLGDVERLCEKVLILSQGKVVEYNSVEELKKKYCSCYYVDIIHKYDSVNQIEQIRKRMSSFAKQTILRKSIERFKSTWEIEKSTIKNSQLFERLEQMKNQKLFKQFVIYEPNLEDIYLKIVKQT